MPYIRLNKRVEEPTNAGYYLLVRGSVRGGTRPADTANFAYLDLTAVLRAAIDDALTWDDGRRCNVYINPTTSAVLEEDDNRAWILFYDDETIPAEIDDTIEIEEGDPDVTINLQVVTPAKVPRAVSRTFRLLFDDGRQMKVTTNAAGQVALTIKSDRVGRFEIVGSDRYRIRNAGYSVVGEVFMAFIRPGE